MTPEEYDAFWRDIDHDPERLPEPARTLAHHVQALWDRLNKLPYPETPGSEGYQEFQTAEAQSWQSQCGCAYDHPDDVCQVHKGSA